MSSTASANVQLREFSHRRHSFLVDHGHREEAQESDADCAAQGRSGDMR
jgi:hypothetical protein